MATPVSPELRLVQQMAGSRYWRWFRAYLIDRREVLFRTPATDTAALHQKEGALQEVNHLLRSPELVAQFLLKQQSAEQAETEPPAAPPPDWLGVKAAGMDVD